MRRCPIRERVFTFQEHAGALLVLDVIAVRRYATGCQVSANRLRVYQVESAVLEGSDSTHTAENDVVVLTVKRMDLYDDRYLYS
jgi:hypothetical protein